MSSISKYGPPPLPQPKISPSIAFRRPATPNGLKKKVRLATHFDKPR